MALTKKECAGRLMEIAAWYSVQSPFGWSSPYCDWLQEGARLLRDEPEPVDTGDAVLSS